ncbi:MAG: hypothetical protein HOP18_28560 [Deltaproteobacteria bacterium]|nr:hypothetical protein [Deltaproteobacteria bacterium]
MSLLARRGAEFFITCSLGLSRCGRAVRALAFPGKGFILQTYGKTVFLGMLSFATLLAFPPLTTAQDTYRGQPEERDRRSGGELNARDRRSFDAYLDEHWETAQLLYQQPELVNDREFLRDHRALRTWLAEHRRAARIIRANPREVLWKQRSDYPRDDGTVPSAKLNARDRRSFDAYLDEHWETAQLLYQQPELINDRQFLRDHSALRDWLAEHPRAARVIRANPREVLWEKRSDHSRADSGIPSTGVRADQPQVTRAISAEEVQSLGEYLDSHWEEADALYREPELINDRQFVRSHPSLDTWLRERPDAARSIRERPRDFFWRQRSVTPQNFLQQLFGR